MIRICKALGLFMLLLACGTQHQLFAQGRLITGTVTSAENKQPLAGVTVSIKGSKGATTTDGQGNFRITVDASATTLIFSNVSFVSFEAAIGSGSSIDVVMQPDPKALQDVGFEFKYPTLKEALIHIIQPPNLSK